MRIKSAVDISQLGPSAKKQIEDVLKEQGGFNNKRRASSEKDLVKKSKKLKVEPDGSDSVASKSTAKKKKKPSRVMKTTEGLNYCKWPSTDPFVSVYQMLERKFGRFDDGGLLLTEMIIEGGDCNWRFDMVILPELEEMEIKHFDGRTKNALVGAPLVTIEADGFGFHRSKSAFQNDRSKQTHALKNGFTVKRVTTDDVRSRFGSIGRDVDEIRENLCIYRNDYKIRRKGKTQYVFSWVQGNTNHG
tara:strand:+ start:13874 stop:14611 length:738 start_codon:yes stop_codon:yes gene_type:complete